MLPVIAVIFWLAHVISGDSVEVTVDKGTIAGETVTACNGEKYISFKGIPYAKPPVGELRFKPPQELDPWDGVRNATEHGSICPQISLFSPGNLLQSTYIPGSEDCLFINVYTPNLKPDEPLPVLVYIHGGQHQYLSGNDEYFAPDYLVTKDIVVVTLNYRLAALGFLSLGISEAPGNAGLKDQVAALKWVQKNIKQFGGNPDSVTIMGESSGAVSVGFHMLSPMSKGLFHRAITQSGAPTCEWALAYEPERRAFKLGRRLGIDTENKTELLSYLRSLPYDQLVNITVDYATVLSFEEKSDTILRLIPFLPSIEGNSSDSFIIQHPRLSLKSGDVNKVDMLFSYNDRETTVLIDLYVSTYLQMYKDYPELFVPSKWSFDLVPNRLLELGDRIRKNYFGNETISVDNIENFISYTSNSSIMYDVQKFNRMWSEYANVYFYKFSSSASRNYFGKLGARYGVYGASHFDEQFYIFEPKSLNFTFDADSVEHKITTRITTAITNYVKSGDPNTPTALEVTWPRFNTSTLSYVAFGTEESTVAQKADEVDYQFWDNLDKELGLWQ